MNLFTMNSVYISETGFNVNLGGDDMDEFQKLLEKEKVNVERFVRFKIHLKADADDILQEVFITAYKKFNQLKNHDCFKAWIISIARNKCSDYFREKSNRLEIPIELLPENDRLKVNGTTYVHWYDCITDYIL